MSREKAELALSKARFNKPAVQELGEIISDWFSVAPGCPDPECSVCQRRAVEGYRALDLLKKLDAGEYIGPLPNSID